MELYRLRPGTWGKGAKEHLRSIFVTSLNAAVPVPTGKGVEVEAPRTCAGGFGAKAFQAFLCLCHYKAGSSGKKEAEPWR